MQILEPWYHIDGVMRCIKYDVAEGLDVNSKAATAGILLGSCWGMQKTRCVHM